VRMYGEDMVYRGGLSVYTTADIRCQEYADSIMDQALMEQNRISSWSNARAAGKIERAYAKLSLKKGAKGGTVEQRAALNRSFFRELSDEVSIASLITGADTVDYSINSALRKYEDMMRMSRVEGAIAAVDPATGDILVLCGGSGFGYSNQLNRAVQSRRQPGSSFKAFVYGAAIASGRITAATDFYDIPLTYKGRRDTWEPSNYDRDYSGRVLVRRAFALSLNVVSAKIYDIAGGEAIVRFASEVTGVEAGRFQNDPTLSLGTTEFTPLEMASGFSVFAGRGFRVEPHAIREIRDSSGKVIYMAEGRFKKRRVMDERTAFIMTSLMREVVDSGTAAYGIRRSGGFTLPCAGKTGTNTGFRDAWFIGFTPGLSVAVWIGCESPEFSLGSGQSGASCAAPVWGRFMSRVSQVRKRSYFASRPEGVTAQHICTVTGKLPDKNCTSRIEYFISGTEPREKCDGLHGRLSNVKELIMRDGKGEERAPDLFRGEDDLTRDGDEYIIE